MKALITSPSAPLALSLIAALVVTWIGCAPEDLDPVSPTLTWISINATEFQSAAEPVTVTLGYQDHQGDLGGQTLTDIHSMSKTRGWMPQTPITSPR